MNGTSFICRTLRTKEQLQLLYFWKQDNQFSILETNKPLTEIYFILISQLQKSTANWKYSLNLFVGFNDEFLNKILQFGHRFIQHLHWISSPQNIPIKIDILHLQSLFLINIFSRNILIFRFSRILFIVRLKIVT